VLETILKIKTRQRKTKVVNLVMITLFIHSYLLRLKESFSYN